MLPASPPYPTPTWSPWVRSWATSLCGTSTESSSSWQVLSCCLKVLPLFLLQTCMCLHYMWPVVLSSTIVLCSTFTLLPFSTSTSFLLPHPFTPSPFHFIPLYPISYNILSPSFIPFDLIPLFRLSLPKFSSFFSNCCLTHQECTSLDISVQLLDACLSSVTSSCQRQADSDPSNCMVPNKDSVPLTKAPFSRAHSFSITSLCLVGSPSSTLLLSHAATEGQSVLLVAGLTVCLGDSTLPVLLLHCFKQQLAGLKQQEATSTQYGSAPSYIPVLSSSSSDQHPAEGNLHSTYSGSPSQSMFDLTCMYLPPSSLAGIENVLDDREEEEEEVPLPRAGGGVAVPHCPEAAQMLSVVPLVHFTSALDESPPEVQSLIPLGGGHLLVVHVRCAKSTGEYPYGGLHVYPVTASDLGQVVLGATPTSTLKFTRESEAVSLCAALGMDDQSQAPCDLIATVTRDGSVVVYGTDLVKVAERPPAHENPYTRVCARVEQLVVVRRSGQTEVMRLVLPPVAGEAMTAEAPIGGKSCASTVCVYV